MIAEDIPNWLQSVVDRVNGVASVYPEGKKANHVLLNEYRAGQGIMPHVDGPLFHPTITTVSLGSHTLLDFYQKTDELPLKVQFSLLVEPGSLLVLKDDLYTSYLHGIQEVEADTVTDKTVVCPSSREDVKPGQVLERTTRVSLTIRHVPNTKKLKIRL